MRYGNHIYCTVRNEELRNQILEVICLDVLSNRDSLSKQPYLGCFLDSLCWYIDNNKGYFCNVPSFCRHLCENIFQCSTCSRAGSMHPLLFGDFHNSKSIFHQTNIIFHFLYNAYYDLLFSYYMLVIFFLRQIQNIS